MARFLIALLLAGFIQTGAATAQTDLIHSDVPLWGLGPKTWPRNVGDDDGSFGCANRIRVGDWRYDEDVAEDDDAEPDRWYRIANYGVVHCFLLVSEAGERDALGKTGFDYSFLIDIGRARGVAGPVELWALQRGGRPGSDYLLLARRAGGSLHNRFDVLPRHCPRLNVRTGPELDALATRYCAINSKRELIELARRMARRRPLGTLRFVGEEEEKGGAAP